MTNKNYTKFAPDLLSECISTLSCKGNDYGHNNFIDAAKVATIITGKEILPHDIAACLIGIKLARYGNLTKNSIAPMNESILDTVKDCTNYVVLMERERRKQVQEKENALSKADGKIRVDDAGAIKDYRKDC
jgi:hypothetical protein